MGGGIEKSRLEAEELLAHTLDMDRLNLYLNPDRPLTAQELDEFRPLIKKRKSGEPLQYITGKSSFMGLTLTIDKRSLIPRPETEEMTEEILSQFREESGLQVLDLGTGSGAIAIALAKFLINPQVTAVDKSPEVLELAQKNAILNDSSEYIEFYESDWFSEVNKSYDIIVSNPPYVASTEIENLSPKIKRHEPIEALNGGEDGLTDIKQILDKAHDYLTDNGAIFLEIGYNQGKKVKKLATESDLAKITLIKDSKDKDRILYGKKKG